MRRYCCLFWFCSTSVIAAQDISGSYKKQAEDGEVCIISLQIEKQEGIFHYHLVTTTKNQKGKVHLKRNAEGDGVYIILEGIEWSETSEDIALPQGEKNIDQETAYDLEAFFSDGEIVIQNTGNSRNYFVKLDECNKKYIQLIKNEKNK